MHKNLETKRFENEKAQKSKEKEGHALKTKGPRQDLKYS